MELEELWTKAFGPGMYPLTAPNRGDSGYPCLPPLAPEGPGMGYKLEHFFSEKT